MHVVLSSLCNFWLSIGLPLCCVGSHSGVCEAIQEENHVVSQHGVVCVEPASPPHSCPALSVVVCAAWHTYTAIFSVEKMVCVASNLQGAIQIASLVHFTPHR